MKSSLRFAFSSLGCPELDLVALRAFATRHQSGLLELRTLGGGLDFVGQLARFPGGAVAARDFLLEADMRIVLLGSSFAFTRATEADRATLIAEAEAGEALGAPWIRVFGGGVWGDVLTPERTALAASHRAWWTALRAARGWTIDLALEMHDAFSGTPQILDFFTHTGGPLPLLWDTHHTWKVAGESAAETWAALGEHVRYVHMKDSVSLPSDGLAYTYVPPGSGEFPLAATLDLLVGGGYEGVVSLEWEKYWHPAIPSLDVALPAWNAVTAPYRAHALPV